MLSVNALFYIQIKCFLFILGSFSMNKTLMNLSVNGYFVDYLWFMLFDTPF